MILHREIFQNKVLCFVLFSFSLLHGRLTADPPSFFSSIPSSPLARFFTLHTWTLFLAFCLLLLFFQSPVLPFSSSISPLPLHHLSLTPSFSPLPLPAYLLSVCPCSVSPLAHLSLSPRAYCHHAQCPPTRLTPLFSRFLSLISVLPSLCIFLSRPYASFPRTRVWSPPIMWLRILWSGVSYLDWNG